MSDPHNIRGICQAVKFHGLPIDNGEPYGGEISPYDPNFDQACYDLFAGTVSYQQAHYPGQQPRLWTPALIGKVVAFLKRHRLPGKFVGPFHPSGAGMAMLSQSAGTIRLGLAAYLSVSEEELLTGLRHEAGHLHDHQLVIHFYPDLKKAYQQEEVNRPLAIRQCDAYLELFRKVMSPRERQEFDALAKKVFGDFGVLSVEDLGQTITILSEVLRYGEEIHDAVRLQTVLGPNFSHFKKDGPPESFYRHSGITNSRGEFVDIQRLALAASFQEAGIWERFKRLPDVDSALIRRFEAPAMQPYVRFFRLAIRAANRFFPTVESRNLMK